MSTKKRAELSPMLDSIRQRFSIHRRRIYDLHDWSKSMRVRHFSGHYLHAEQLNKPIRIAHLTDQHVGLVTPMEAQQAAVDLANSYQPDLVVITGDFVCHSQLFLEDLTYLMRKIQAPVYAVLGNHDHWSGAQAVREALKKGHVELLSNQNTLLYLRGEALQLVGLEDAYTGHADVTKAVKGMQKEVATLGLSHIAEKADELFTHHVPLVLSGHTHAGQVTVAGLQELLLGKIIGHKYIHGLYGHQDKSAPHGAVYVGAGVGAAVMPLRLGEKGMREIAIFELGASLGSIDENQSVPEKKRRNHLDDPSIKRLQG